MIKSFADPATRAIFEGRQASGKDAKKARRRLPTQLWERARAKMDMIDAAGSPASLDTPSNRLERLKGDREGQYSIRINRQYRICFEWEDGDAEYVEVVDYH